ncbi:LOW QUALITY PROTEIN: battenin [Procambarus clarkii]|uniref:LOW QUALITY PROTEIN: battenin n=1 Tax=Procambarus clarkii TaxID=6728 RepID=UPI001E673D50|nr:battenin-like [Procambarus clarkii]XP_045604738.1 battenin-like [Procambarus clarkii]
MVLYKHQQLQEDAECRQCILQECDDSPCPRLASDGATEADEKTSSAADKLLKQQQEEDPSSQQQPLRPATPSHPGHLTPPAHPAGRRKGRGTETDGEEPRGREKKGRERDEELEEGIGMYRGPPRRHRDLVAYWLLGFCNNFTYWVMITAAYDLLSSQSQTVTERSQQQSSPTLQNSSSVTIRPPYDGTISQNESVETFVNTFKCLRHSTGAILVADTLPATALTLAAPLTLLAGVDLRVWLVGGLCVASYLVLGLATSKFVFLGVALASASRGFSDTTFLGHAAHYHKHVLSLWSSGTGVATFLGPLLYSSLTTGGMSPRHALLVFLIVPIIIVVSFWCILSRLVKSEAGVEADTQDTLAYNSAQDAENDKQKRLAIVKEKLFLLLRAKQYLLPLSVFYFIMYFTNQGLLELVYFPASHLTHAQQYSWSNTVRCLGTLISRSAHKFFLLPSTWIYSALAMVIVLVVGTEAHYHYLPSEYIIFTLLFLQGLLEGAAFRSTVFNMHEKAGDKEREFCLGIFPVSLFLPAMLAGFASIPVHDVLCQNHLYQQ